MYKVVLIVDNPKRDLSGLSLLAYQLVQYEIEVFLVPMYEQELHIYSINPDFILLNYCRPINSHKILKYKKLGFSIGVLDTEGGILRDIYSELLISVEKSKVASFIDIYFLWGPKQYDVFKDYFSRHQYKTSIVKTGVPRYDFFHDSFKAFSPFSEKLNYYILIIASFPLCNPKFVSLEEEAKNMSEALEYTYEETRNMQSLSLIRMNKYLELIKKLLKTYPDNKFVLRAHPFENHDVYKDFFSECNNVIFNDSGEIFSVLHDARLVVQINSSTGTEAAMIGKPVLQPDFLKDSIDAVEQVEKSSYLAKSEVEFFDMFNMLVREEHNEKIIKRTVDINKYVKGLISDYFVAIDGKSSIRVASEINKFISQQELKKRKLIIFIYFIRTYVYTFIKGTLKLFLKKEFVKKRKEKEISEDIVVKISELYNNREIMVKEKIFYSFLSIKSKAVHILKFDNR